MSTEEGRSLRRTLLALGVISIGGLLLYLPLMIRPTKGNLSRIETSTLFHSIQDYSIQQLTVAAASILFPLLLDNALDLFFRGWLVDSIERMMYLSYACASFILQSSSRYGPEAVLVYGCSMCFQVWLISCFAMTSLNRYEPTFFSYRNILFVLGPMFAFLFSAIWYMSFGGTSIVSTVTKSIAAATYLIFHLIYLFGAVCNWRKSKEPFFHWISNLPSNKQSALISTCFVIITFLIFSLLSPAFDSKIGILSITTEFLRVYLTVSIAFSTLITIVPNRLSKLHTEKLKTDLELKKTFVRYISHELRTPLTIVVNGLELLEEQVLQGSSSDDLIGLVHDLKESCSSGVDILNELLEFEKLESGLSKMEKSVQDPLLLIETTAAPFKMVTRLKGIEFLIENHLQDGVLVDIDETKVCGILDGSTHYFGLQIAQVLRNFLSNATKFTPIGGKVSLDVRVKEDMLIVEVRDSGVGLSDEQQRRLFHEIIQFNAKAQQAGGGSGLGLWISRKIIDLHGGIIGVHSEGVDRGSLFFFGIPIIRSGNNDVIISLPSARGRNVPVTRFSAHLSRVIPEDAGVPQDRTDDANNHHSSRETVLVVDDSALVRKLLRKLFEKEGYSVAEAEDGDVAEAMVRRSISTDGPQYSIISMDNVR